MNRQFDALTVALTGQLTLVLVVAAVFALAFSLFPLWSYRTRRYQIECRGSACHGSYGDR